MAFLTTYYNILLSLLKTDFPELVEYWDQPKELQKQLSAKYATHPKYKAAMYAVTIILEEEKVDE